MTTWKTVKKEEKTIQHVMLVSSENQEYNHAHTIGWLQSLGQKVTKLHFKQVGAISSRPCQMDHRFYILLQ